MDRSRKYDPPGERRRKAFLAIYNDQGKLSTFWRTVKRAYNHTHPRLRFLILWPIGLYFVTGFTLKDILRLRRPRNFSENDDVRGMSVWANVVDWVGGYPFEVASREKVIGFYRQRGFYSGAAGQLRTQAGLLATNYYQSESAKFVVHDQIARTVQFPEVSFCPNCHSTPRTINPRDR